MTELLLAAALCLLLGNFLLLVLLLRRQATPAPAVLARFDALTATIDRLERHIQTDLTRPIREDLATARRETADQARSAREEGRQSLHTFSEQLLGLIRQAAEGQEQRQERMARRIGEMGDTADRRAEALRQTVEKKLQELRDENTQKLEAMRQTVEEKLQGTLDKRLGESFKQVSDRLEQVHKGLGEMQTLASGVGDLKRVMTNIKTRGTWGEVQLGAILEQILTPEQFDANVATRPGSNERVEYAIRLPGREEGDRRPVYLPIDAKFPAEDYQRLIDAQEAADAGRVATATRQLEQAIRHSARDIATKYLAPPHTTDFAVLFLPTEGLYAEVVRRTELVEQCQRTWRVVLAGPTTLAAILNSLQMGFRTLAIQQRSSEVWEVLGAVKSEFGKFGGVLEKVRKKLQEASNTVGDAERRTRVMNRKLREVEALPSAEGTDLLSLSGATEAAESDPAHDLDSPKSPD